MQNHAYVNSRGVDFMHGFIATCERRRFLVKAVIIAQNEISQDLYFLIKGTATLRLRTPSGHDLVVAVMHGGDFFGEAGLFEGNCSNGCSVRAKTGCEIARISHTRLRSHPALLAGIMALLAPQLVQRLDELSRRTAEMAFYDIERRVTSTLRELALAPDAHPHVDGSAIHMTRTELGAMTGASREAVGRVLIRLQKRGMVSSKGRVMIVRRQAGTAQHAAPRVSSAAAVYGGVAPPA